MDRTSLALTVAFGAVAVVLLGVWALAHFGERAMLNPPTPQTMRRLGMASVVFGCFAVVLGVTKSIATGAIDAGAFFQGLFLVAMGVMVARQHRATS